MAYLVYKIRNNINDKIYVGITTVSLRSRYTKHRHDIKRLSNLPLYRAMALHGIDNFEISLLEECNSLEEMKLREMFWIKALACRAPNGYNITDGGEANNGHARPDVALRNKLGIGKKLTQEHKDKVGAAHCGMKRPEGTGAKIAATKIGKPRSEETIAKMKMRKVSEETKEKIRASLIKFNNPVLQINDVEYSTEVIS